MMENAYDTAGRILQQYGQAKDKGRLRRQLHIAFVNYNRRGNTEAGLFKGLLQLSRRWR